MSGDVGARDPGVIVSEGELTLRLMRDAVEEFERLVEWRNQPHVREWWDPDDPPMTVDQAVAEVGPDVTGTTAMRAAIIEVANAPVGFVQYYPWSAEEAELATLEVAVPPGSWGLDILIGDPRWVERGIGSRVVRLLCDHLFTHEGATAIAFGVDRDNLRARRAYERAGMVATVEFLDTDTRGGRRVTSLLMVRVRPSAGPHDRLRELGLTLPRAPAAVAAYVPVSVAPLGNGRSLVSVSGQVPVRDGHPVLTGRVPDEVSVNAARECARLCGLNLLAQLDSAVGLDNVESILQLSAFVRCSDDFTGQPQVAAGRPHRGRPSGRHPRWRRP